MPSDQNIVKSLQILSGVIALMSTTPALALSSDTRVADAPFSDPDHFQKMADTLPVLGYEDDTTSFSKQLAVVAKTIGEASQQNSNNTTFGHQAGIWAFNHFREEVASRVASEGQSLLSPYGSAQIDFNVDMEGNLTGSGASLLTPWADRYQYLTFSQVGLHQTHDGLAGSVGVGQRWVAGKWLMGYNGFVDRMFDSGLQRASFGTEAWGDYLRFSANYYTSLSGWQNRDPFQQQRVARGYGITTQGYLPFYRQLGMSVNWEQYLGNNVDLFNSGNRYHDPSALTFGVSFTPVPLVTFSASHKTSNDGESQDQFGLRLNYHFGVPLEQQLSADNVAEARSLRGSRYDMVSRSDAPVLAYRQHQTLTVFLATPPWQLNGNESLPLKLQIRSANPITQVIWQGDTQALSLTPGANPHEPQGWSIIMPAWDSTPGASNSYRLAVVLVDSKQNRETSNWITLQLQEPFSIDSGADDRFNLMAP